MTDINLSSGEKHIILTGSRGSGKTTLLKELKVQFGGDAVPGLVTWSEPGKAVYMRRTGSDERITVGVFDPTSTSKENRMKPVTEGFEVTGIALLEELTEDPSEWVSVDEIGYLEGECLTYLRKLEELFSRKRVMAVVRKQDAAHLNALVRREDALVIDLDLYEK